MMNCVLISESQRITLYANKKTTPSRDGYTITQIKRSFSLICNYFIFCSLLHNSWSKVNTFLEEYKIILYFLQDRYTKFTIRIIQQY